MSDVRQFGSKQGPGNVRGRRRRLRRAGAVVTSLAIHAAIFVVAFSGASGALVSAGGAGGAPTGPVFTVTVVSTPQLSSVPRTSDAGLKPLFAKFRLANGEAVVVDRRKASSDVASLIETVQKAQARPQAISSSHGIQVADARGSPRPSQATAPIGEGANADQADPGQVRGSASTGKLWGAIEPCWRNLGARGRVPVTLEVALDGTGDLRTPPKVIRSNTALLNEPRLQAEASALAAVAACVPRGDLRFSGKVYRLEFPGQP